MPITSAKINTPASLRSELIAIRSESLIDIAGIANEWAKRQLAKQGVGFTVLDNGFLECDEPERLQAVCDWLGPDQIERLLRKWLARLPLTTEDRQAGYDYQLSIWQLEVSLTQIFDHPLRGRQFFEEVIRDNLDLGRPDRLQLVFERQVRKNTPGPFRTRVIQDGVNPSLHIQYKQCQLKQYSKEDGCCAPRPPSATAWTSVSTRD